MVKRIKGILFDLGNTLLDFEKANMLKLFEAGGRLAHAYLEKLGGTIPSFEEYHWHQRRAIRWHILKSYFTRRDFNSMDLIVKYNRTTGLDLTREQTEELAWLWYEPLRRCATVEEGLREMLVEFRDAGLRLSLISNTFIPPEVLDRHLRQEGLLELLPVRVYSCRTGYRKPNPRIFADALGKMGVPACRTLFVGDLPKADIRGANRAGCISVLKDPAGRYARSRIRPRHRIARLAELAAIVAGYNGG